MTYFGFLAIFLGIPVSLLSALTIFDWRRGKWQPKAFNNWLPLVAIVVHCIIAFCYTFFWDNYLVATGVWYYDPNWVTGIIFWYVPLEEYIFFILQPIFTGLFLFTLMRYMPINPQTIDSRIIRLGTTTVIGILWFASLSLLVSEWRPGTYLGLLFIWVLPPIMLQLAFGADILLRHWRLVILGIILPTLYLSWADSLAMNAGTWMIAPDKSLGIILGGILPIEEALFFLMTNILIVCGITLMMATESLPRSQIERIGIFREVIRQKMTNLDPH